jgi:peptide/nickel transport system substrate-binding protein
LVVFRLRSEVQCLKPILLCTLILTTLHVILPAPVLAGLPSRALTLAKSSRSGAANTMAPLVNPDLNQIVEETVGQPTGLDPATDYETAGAAIIQNVYETLLFYNGASSDQVVPWLAQSYEVSSDGLTYTFHLRTGISFSDGTPFDANAVYFSLMRSMIIDDPNGPAWAMLQVVRGGQSYSKQYNGKSLYGSTYTWAELNDFVNAHPVEVIDPTTVAIHLDHEYSAFASVLAFSVAAIVSPTAFKQHWTTPTGGTPYITGATAGDWGNQLNPWPASNMVGTGPYLLQSWDKSTQTLTLIQNGNYWGGPAGRGLAPIPQVVIKGVNDVNTRVTDCQTGATDICSIPVTGGSIFQFADQNIWSSQHNLVSLSTAYNVYPKTGLWSTLTTTFAGFNQNILDANSQLPASFQPFQDVRIRRAFTLSFDRNAYLNGIQGFEIAATQIIPAGMFGYDPTIQPTPYDPDTAKQLLLDAGANPLNANNAFSPSNPKTVTITYNTGNTVRQTIATLIANAVNAYAADTGLTVMTQAGLAWRSAGMFLSGWTADYDDPDDFLIPLADGNTGYFATTMSYNNPTVTSLIDQQATITDTTQRLQKITQIENLVNGDWAYLWMTYGYTYAISRSWLQERPNAYVAGGIQTRNPVIYGYYFYEIQISTAQPFVSGTFLVLLPLTGGTSSGPHGDQSSPSTTFTPSMESVLVAGTGSQQYLLVATSQLWDSSPSIGASMAICLDGSRISGDMYSAGAVATHRHLATAVALDMPSAGSHTYSLCFKTDPGGTAFVSGTLLIVVPVSGGVSSGPDGDQPTGSTGFVDSLESITVSASGSQQYLALATSQLWDSSPSIGASMAVCMDGSRLSGDMYSAGAVATHRHLATAIALSTPSTGSHSFSLCYKTDPGGTAFVSGTFLIVVPVSDALSSGPHGDQTAISTTFTDTMEIISITASGSQQYLAIATSQLWDTYASVGASIAVCRDSSRISGDMYSVGAIASHRHLATAITLDTPSAGDHTYSLCYKTDPGNGS